jgi:dipeptidyl aminopeptidase/acylaminoacyl peptidase
MKKHCLQVLVAALCLGAVSFGAHADAPNPIPAAEFAKHSQFGIPSMSPNGEYLAVSVHDPNDAADGSKYEVGVFHLPEMKPISRLDMPAQTVPIQIAWTSNTRLIVVPAKEVGWLDEPQRTGDLIAVDYDGNHQQSMYGWRALHTHGLPVAPGFFSGLPSKPNGHFYWTVNLNHFDKANEGLSEIYDVDAETGSATSMGRINSDGMRFLAYNGVARIAYGTDDKNNDVLFERDNNDQPWRKLHTSARSAVPVQISDDGTHVYWKYSADGGPYALAISNFDLSDLKILASDAFGSIVEVLWTPYPRKPFAAMVDIGRPKIIYLDDDNSATIHKALSEQFPDLLIRFAAISEDGSRVLVQADSDRDPGLYALFTLNPVSFKPLFKMASWIDPTRMAPRVPIRFTATDGLPLDGYLTMPARGSKLPLVLLPHGGPIDIRDRWDYDAWAQLSCQPRLCGVAGQLPRFGRPRSKFSDRRLQAVRHGYPARSAGRRALGRSARVCG